MVFLAQLHPIPCGNMPLVCAKDCSAALLPQPPVSFCTCLSSALNIAVLVYGVGATLPPHHTFTGCTLAASIPFFTLTIAVNASLFALIRQSNFVHLVVMHDPRSHPRPESSCKVLKSVLLAHARHCSARPRVVTAGTAGTAFLSLVEGLFDGRSPVSVLEKFHVACGGQFDIHTYTFFI
jgi:hypothetical protein